MGSSGMENVDRADETGGSRSRWLFSSGAADVFAAVPFCLSLVSPTSQPCPCLLPRILHLLSAAINSLAQVGADRTVPGPYQDAVFWGWARVGFSGGGAGALDSVSKWGGRTTDGGLSANDTLPVTI